MHQAHHCRAADLHVENLHKTYDGVHSVLGGIDLAVPAGSLVSLLGPSGCGKSTVLRIIAGLALPSAGRILVGGHDITSLPAHARNMGLVFQNYALFPHLSVARNVAFGLEMRGTSNREIRRQVEDALSMVQLDGLGSRMPRQLSGGQQQRVALARALVVRPDLLLLDEPLSNLDAKLREEMRNEIRDLQQKVGITTVFVTHDQGEALVISDRVAIMQHGQVIQCGSPIEIYERPASAEVAAFVGHVNQFDGRVVRSEGDRFLVAIGGTGEVWVPGQMGPGVVVTLIVRPHFVRIVSESSAPIIGCDCNRLFGTVVKMSYSGNHVEITAQLGSEKLLAECPSNETGWRALNVGDRVAIDWEIDDGFAFARSDAL